MMGNPSSSVQVHQINSKNELGIAFNIRNKVFVEEQKVDKREEYDEFEDSSTHYLATIEGKPVGTARWRKTDNGIKLERFAVLAEFRSLGIGSALVKKVLEDIPHDGSIIYLHAQLTAIGLYQKFSFVEEGNEFVEANIRHYKMVWKKE